MRYSKAKLLEFAKKECLEHGVKLFVHTGKYILCDGNPVSGWFDKAKNPPELHIAKGKKDWDTVLSHELCHVYQWLENCLAWKKYDLLTVNLDNWLNGKEWPKKDLNKVIKYTINMERDCERRSLTLLESMGYTKSAEYTKKGNAYILFYFFVAETRLWSKPGKSPYSQKEIWEQFPDTWEIDLKETYKQLKHLYNKCL